MGDVVPDFVKDCRLIWLGLLYPWICYQYVVPKRRYITTNLGCITSQKSEGRIYIAAEAWNHTVVYQSLSDRLPFEWSSKKFDLRLIYIYIYKLWGPGFVSQNNDLLRAGRSGDQSSVGSIFSAPTDRPWGPPWLPYNGYQVTAGAKTAGVWRWPSSFT